MKTYKVKVSREDYGYIFVHADNEDEAREKIEEGEWEDEDYIVKNGGVVVDEVEEIKI